MKVLAATDFHQNEELVNAVVEEANSGDYDLFLSGGDFESVESFHDVMDRIKIPKLACTGNWDFGFTPPDNDEYDHLFNYMKVDFEGYKIVLIGAVFPDDYIEDIQEWLGDTDSQKLIVVSHYPPHRVGDKALSGNRAGLEGFRELIMKTKPAAWICGHIHEAFGQYNLRKTDVFNTAVADSRKCFAFELGDDGVESAEEVELV